MYFIAVHSVQCDTVHSIKPTVYAYKYIYTVLIHSYMFWWLTPRKPHQCWKCNELWYILWHWNTLYYNNCKYL